MGRVEFEAGADQVRTYIRLKDEMAKLRGFDLGGSKKGPRVPRTTNGDVEALIQRWSEEIAFAFAAAMSESKSSSRTRQIAVMKKIVAKWRRTADTLNAVAARNPDNAVFPENVRFWNATKKLAIDLSAVKAFSGQSWALTLADIGEAVVDAPRVIAKSVGKGARAAGKAARVVGETAGSVAGGFLSGAGLPALLLAGVVLYGATSRKR